MTQQGGVNGLMKGGGIARFVGYFVYTLFGPAVIAVVLSFYELGEYFPWVIVVAAMFVLGRPLIMEIVKGDVDGWGVSVLVLLGSTLPALILFGLCRRLGVSLEMSVTTAAWGVVAFYRGILDMTEKE